MFIDTHCHLSTDDYEDIDLVINDNLAAGVCKIIVSGCSKKDIDEVVELSSMYDSIYITLGFHPSEVSNIDDSDLERLEFILKSTKKVVGVGEIGLDYYYGKEDIELQKTLFKKQLEIAQRLKLPVVIHSRDAVKDTIDILKEYDVTGVIHCFSGSLETARTYISMGYKLGIGGVVTFKNSNLYKVVEQIDLSDILLETDSPYLTPEPFRGTKNSSKYIPLIAEKIANIKNIDLSLVESVTSDNANKVFDLK